MTLANSHVLLHNAYPTWAANAKRATGSSVIKGRAAWLWSALGGRPAGLDKDGLLGCIPRNAANLGACPTPWALVVAIYVLWQAAAESKAKGMRVLSQGDAPCTCPCCVSTQSGVRG